MTQLDGRTAIVTGGASGIGEALVRRLVDAGAQVLAADLDAARGAALAAATGCSFRATDVAAPAENEALVATAVTELGGLDLAFLNAGILGRSIDDQRTGEPFDPAGLDPEAYRHTMAVNLDGVVFGVRAAVAAMERGAIVATASVAGVMPWPPDPVYTVSKHGVVGFVRAVAPALEPVGITINAICPGGVATPLVGASPESGLPLLHPDAVADAMLDAATDGGTGRAITVVKGCDPVAQPLEFAPIPGF